MARYLLIAEKPSVMRDIQKVYQRIQSDYEHELIFGAFVGHVVETFEPQDYDPKYQKWSKEDLPIIPEEFKYAPKKQTMDVYKELKKMIQTENLDGIISATDAGREGELIYWAFDDTVEHDLPVYRYWASDSTEESVEKALRNLIEPGNEDIKNLEIASRLRAEFDWLVGMNFSRAATMQTGVTLPLGRVQTPTLRLIVDRELEIQNFVPQPFFEIEGMFEGYTGDWFDEETNNRRFQSKEDAEKVIQSLEGETEGHIIKLDKREKRSSAPTLHSLLELQKEAGKAFGMSAKQVLDTAQKLYEERKLITYPRTDSRHIPKSMADEITKHIAAVTELPNVGSYAKRILEDNDRIQQVMKMKRYVDDKKVTDHHAILPTAKKGSLQGLSTNEKNLYLLIVRRFLAIFLPPQVTDTTTVVTQVADEVFRTKGSIVREKGYKAIYEGVVKEKKDKELPALEEGQVVTFEGATLLEKETTPPKRFDDPDLLTAMSNVGNQVDEEELKSILKDVAGLGTSATRAGIVENLIYRKWVVRKGKTLFPTVEGVRVIQTLGDREITSPLLTAEWEGKLQQVEAGELSADDFRHEMHEYIKHHVEELGKNLQRLSSGDKQEVKVIGTCPKCQTNVVKGKNHYFCENYKDTCDFLIGGSIAGSKTTEDDVKKLLSGEVTAMKTFKFKNNRKGKAQLKLSDTGELEFLFEQPKGTGLTCPKCGGDIRESSKGFYCENTPKKECTVMMSKKLLGATISKEDMEKLLAGELTALKTFQFKKGKGQAQLQLKEDYSLAFVFPKHEKKVIGDCPKCNGNIVTGKNYFLCENYKKSCDVIFGKVFGATLTEKDVKTLLEGGKTEPKKLTFKSGKTSNAAVVLDEDANAVPEFFLKD